MKTKLLSLIAILFAAQSFGAVLYLRSTDGNDADSGATWALAKATLAGAFTAAAAGDTIYVSQVHAETQASAMTLTSPGTAAAPCRVICVNDGAEPPTAVATTATITTTGGFSITCAGFCYIYGITFNCGTSTGNGSFNVGTSATSFYYKFEKCSVRIVASGVANRITLGSVSVSSDDELVEFVDTTISLSATAQGVVNRCRFKWSNTASALLGTIPTTLFLTPSTGNAGPAEMIGVDLSAAGSGKNLVDAGQPNFNSYYLQNCKLGDSVAITTGAVAGQGGTEVTLVNCDSTNSNYRYYKQTYQGIITHETGIIRTNGATDGTTAFSRKMVSSADAKYFSPLESNPIEYWNESTNAITITIPVITDNVTLTDAEAWIEVLYLGTAGFPLGVTVTDRSASILATPANQTTDATSAWNTTGLTTPIKQSLSTSVTPTLKGMIRARVMLAKPTTTMYYDPKIIPGVRQFMIGQSGVHNDTAITVGHAFSN